jgi:hypothetical protein
MQSREVTFKQGCNRLPRQGYDAWHLGLIGCAGVLAAGCGGRRDGLGELFLVFVPPTCMGKVSRNGRQWRL